MPIMEGSTPLALPGGEAQVSRKPEPANEPLFPGDRKRPLHKRTKLKNAFKIGKTAFGEDDDAGGD